MTKLTNDRRFKFYLKNNTYLQLKNQHPHSSSSSSVFSRINNPEIILKNRDNANRN